MVTYIAHSCTVDGEIKREPDSPHHTKHTHTGCYILYSQRTESGVDFVHDEEWRGAVKLQRKQECERSDGALAT